MPRVTLAQSSFTAGELSPRVQGRTDLDRYQTGLKRARNAHALIHGGIKRRAGSRFIAEAATATAERSILVPFVAGRGRAWMLEFSNLSVRVFNTDGTLAGVTLATPYSDATLDQLDWAQSDSTLYLFHPSYPVQRLQRLGQGTWVLSPAPFTTTPFAEVGLVPLVAAALDNPAVGTRALTTAAPAFLLADNGRIVTCDAGVGLISGYSSTTAVTLTVTRAFSSAALPLNQWTIEGSPQTSCTPSAVGPVGSTMQLVLGVAGWRAGDVGSMVRINGGLCRITAFTSALQVDAVVVRELAGVTAAPPLSWSLEPPVWGGPGGVYGYPRTGTVAQQRLIVAGNWKFPRTVWGSRIGEPLDFELGTDDDLAFAFTIDSDESSPISYVTSTPDLIVLTESGEYSMRGGVEKPVTPTNVRVRQESNHGCAGVRPVLISRETVFVQRAGRKLRGLGYRYDFDGYTSPDITALADHITHSGIRWMAYQQEPELMLWAVRNDGMLASCTIDRDQQPAVLAWALHETAGAFECVASVPGADRDDLWLIVRREINGETVRYIERLDETLAVQNPALFPDATPYGCMVDCAVFGDDLAGLTVIDAPHLVGCTVDVVADGAKLARQVVPASGTLTLPRPAKRVIVGLPYSSLITLLTPEFPTATGSAQGQAARTGELVMRFLETIGAQVINSQGARQDVPFRQLGPAVLDAPPPLFTGLLRITLLGWERGESEISIVQDDPMPLHLLAVIRTHTVNG